MVKSFARFLESHWLSVYHVFYFWGGISGGILFYPKLVSWFYTYLQQYGFNHPAFEEQLNQLPFLIIRALFIFTFIVFLFRFVFSHAFSRKMQTFKRFLYWCKRCIKMISLFGLVVAIVYYIVVPAEMLVYNSWSYYMVSVICFFFVLRFCFENKEG